MWAICGQGKGEIAMTMTEWADNEIRLFMERASEEDRGHIEAAASAYRSLMEDDHSGMSMDITLSLISDLIDANEENPGKWAEVRKALEKAGVEEDEDEYLFEYACACVDSAVKAYGAMLKAEKPVSNRAKELLGRLVKGLPLSPITDGDFISDAPSDDWEAYANDCWLKRNGLKSHVQCPGMFSLFREEHLDGSVTYSDANRVIYMDQHGHAWVDGEAVRTVDRLFPITMPYYPADKPFIVHGRRDGATDVRHYDYLVTPDGKSVDLNIKVDEREEGE